MSRKCTFALLFVCACGGASPPPSHTVTVEPQPSSSVAKVDPPHPPPPALKLLYEQKAAPDAGIALDGTQLLVSTSGTLHVYDETGEKPVMPTRARPAPQIVVVGEDIFDLVDHSLKSPPLPSALHCEPRSKSFSLDATRMAANCRGPQGEEIVLLFDARSGAKLGAFEEFRTAAPIRAGTITDSGNFIFWVARASGAFEEIKSHVTGPLMSSHSVMAPDEHATFTTVDRQWYTDDRTPAQMLDPHNGRQLFVLGTDVDMVFFSPSSHLFAARHSKNWSDLMKATQPDHTKLTLHKDSADLLIDLPGDDVVAAVFSSDDACVAVRHASGVVSVYALSGAK